MYADNTLTPKEAVRLCALGILSDGPKAYGDLASEIRYFVSRVTGPSLELMGESIELLRYEGLVEPAGEEIPEGQDQVLQMTGDGREMLASLLAADVRAEASSLTELVLALKFRFIHLLPGGERDRQIETVIEACDTELARLGDLAEGLEGDGGLLAEWLGHDLERLEKRRRWLESLKAREQ